MVAPQPLPLALQFDFGPITAKLQTVEENLTIAVNSAKNDTINAVDTAKEDVRADIGVAKDEILDGTVAAKDEVLAGIEAAKGELLDALAGSGTEVLDEIRAARSEIVGEIRAGIEAIADRLDQVFSVVTNIDRKVPEQLGVTSTSGANAADMTAKIDTLTHLMNQLNFDMLLLQMCGSQQEVPAVSQALDKLNIRDVEGLARWAADPDAAAQQLQKQYKENNITQAAPSVDVIKSVGTRAQTTVGYTGSPQKKKVRREALAVRKASIIVRMRHAT